MTFPIATNASLIWGSDKSSIVRVAGGCPDVAPDAEHNTLPCVQGKDGTTNPHSGFGGGVSPRDEFCSQAKATSIKRCPIYPIHATAAQKTAAEKRRTTCFDNADAQYQNCMLSSQ
jgi:hypothetical protein